MCGGGGCGGVDLINSGLFTSTIFDVQLIKIN